MSGALRISLVGDIIDPAPPAGGAFIEEKVP